MKTCLVVDDSRLIRKVARQILEHLQFQVIEAEDGRQALDACAAAMPDAVFLDWSMPEVDGLAFLRRLRASPGGASPTVVVCSIESDPGQIAAAREAGAAEYILKPFDFDIVQAKFQGVGLLD
jgi:two-component system chemotaxis response regulator CheY